MITQPAGVSDNPRAILFEDEDTIRIEARDHFLELGVHVDAYEDPGAAMDALMTAEYDAGFFDINDQNGNSVGLELVRKFQERNAAGLGYIVTMHPSFKIHAKQMGVEFIKKPFKRTVREAISERLHGKRLSLRPLRGFKIERIDSVVEWLDDSTCSLSFYQKQLGWMVIHVPLRDIPASEVAVGDVVRAGIIVDDRGAVNGFRLALGNVRRPAPDENTTAGEALVPGSDVDFNDPEAVVGYRKALKAFFHAEDHT